MMHKKKKQNKKRRTCALQAQQRPALGEVQYLRRGAALEPSVGARQRPLKLPRAERRLRPFDARGSHGDAGGFFAEGCVPRVEAARGREVGLGGGGAAEGEGGFRGAGVGARKGRVEADGVLAVRQRLLADTDGHA